MRKQSKSESVREIIETVFFERLGQKASKEVAVINRALQELSELVKKKLLSSQEFPQYYMISKSDVQALFKK